MGKFILGLIVGVLLVPFAVYWYFASGHVPTAVSSQPMPFEKRLAKVGLHSAIKNQGVKQPPFQPVEADYMAAVDNYRQHCAVCHGLIGQDKSFIAKGMYPEPPQLWKGKGVSDDPAGETYWKVANGIRLTGMPGFTSSLSDKQMWQISLLLANADKLPASVTDLLKKPAVMEIPQASQAVSH